MAFRQTIQNCEYIIRIICSWVEGGYLAHPSIYPIVSFSDLSLTSPPKRITCGSTAGNNLPTYESSHSSCGIQSLVVALAHKIPHDKMEVNVRLIIIGVYIKIAQEFGYWHLQYFSPHTIYAIDKLCGQSIKWPPSDLYKTY